MQRKPSRTPPGMAREKLLQAALDLFGTRGFDGVSTREIASRAGVNIAGITYQFGGKRELYNACLAHVAAFIRVAVVDEALAGREVADDLTPESAAQALRQLLSGFVRFLLIGRDIERLSRLLVREQMDPTEAFEPFYRGVLEPMHRHACQLFGIATRQDPESEAVKATVFSMVGQIVIFRIARAGTMRRLGWKTIGAAECARIETVILHTLDAVLAQSEREARI